MKQLEKHLISRFEEIAMDKISEGTVFSGRQLEEEVMQVFDLYHFIKAYDPGMKVIDWEHHRVNIVEHMGFRKGLFFCDLIYSIKYFFNASYMTPFICMILRNAQM